jgi:hypothetical protein
MPIAFFREMRPADFPSSFVIGNAVFRDPGETHPVERRVGH